MRFPLVRADARMSLFLALDYAEHGALSAFLRRGGKGFGPRRRYREIAGILDVLRKLLAAQTLPSRSDARQRLRLRRAPAPSSATSGIVLQQSDARGITAHTMNQMTLPERPARCARRQMASA